MDDTRPVLISTEEANKAPVLIIDKKGTMGLILAKQLRDQFLVVFVSGHEIETHEDIIHVPYHKNVPIIPDNHYSHIFVFYNGEPAIVDILPALIKKANTSKGHIFFITSLPHSELELFRRLSHELYSNVQIILYGEIFYKNAIEQNLVMLFIDQAKKYGRIYIPNDGLGKLYPIYLDDVYDAIVATAFSWEKKRLVFVFPKHPISELSIARMLQKQDPLLELDFRPYKGTPPRYYIPSDGEYYFADYPLEKRLHEVAASYEVTVKEEEPKKKKQSFPKQKNPIKPLTLWIALFGLLIAPILITAFVGVSGAAALQISIREVERGKIDQAQGYAAFAKEAFAITQSIGGSLFYLDPILKTQKVAALEKVATAKRLAEAELDILHALTLLQSVSDDKSADPKKDFKEALAIIKNSLITVQKMRAEGDLPQSVNDRIAKLEPVLLPLENTIDAFPALLGFEGKREYLVLFQNNMEIRPGGGFIGSYGLVKMEKGRMTDFTVHDVYDADGKLSVHIEPPFGLRRYMGAAHWFLRDSNFAIDFPKNAKQAKTFLQLETGENVDGVIAIDTTFLKNMLSAMGPVTIVDYHETVTADNFYLMTQNHAEKDFFPGSTQKKDFLRALLDTMEQKMATKQNINYQAMVGKIGESILGKHLLFVFSDDAVQQLFAVNNLSGSLWDNRDRGENTYLDFFGVIDANVGANKSNYYLKRSIDQKIIMDEHGSLQTTSTITYTNTSEADSPFGGEYKNYVRFVLPPNVALREVRIDDKVQATIDAVTDPEIFTAKRFVAPREMEIESSQEQGKDSIGFLLIVPVGSTKKVSIVYESVRAVDTNKPAFVSDLWVFKQAGTQEDPYTLSFSYPPTYRLVHADRGFSDVGGKLLYSNLFSKDLYLRAQFSKK